MSEILDFQAGREARMNGKLRDGRRNADWLRGWDQVDADERLYTIERRINRDVQKKQAERDRLNPPVFIDPFDPRYFMGAGR